VFKISPESQHYLWQFLKTERYLFTREQTVTSCCLSSNGVMQLILGTNSGSVLTFDIDGLQLSEEVLTRDKLLQRFLI